MLGSFSDLTARLRSSIAWSLRLLSVRLWVRVPSKAQNDIQKETNQSDKTLDFKIGNGIN